MYRKICERLSIEKERVMTAASSFFHESKHPQVGLTDKRQPMDIVKAIQKELEKSGMESYLIGKKVEDLLARVYFPSVN